MSDSQPRFEHLNATNYNVWKIRMKAYLKQRGWWDVVVAADTVAIDGSKDEKALTSIQLSVTDQYLHLIAKVANAKEAWETLEKIHQSKTFARRLLIRRELTSLRLGSETITAYYTRAKAIHDSLLEIEDNTSDDDLVCALLAGLPAAYDSVVTSLSAPRPKDQTLGLEEVFAQLLVEEQRQAARRGTTSGGKDQEESKALTAQHKGRNGGRRKGGKTKGKEQPSRDKDICRNCGEMGHWKVDCPHPPKGGVAFAAQVTAQASSDWVLDSGASSHMTADRSILEDYRSLKEVIPIKFGNGESANAVGVGDYTFTVAGEEAKLRRVYHVPELFTNLMSLSCAASSGATITLAGSECRIQYGAFTAITATQSEGLWRVRLQGHQEHALSAGKPTSDGPASPKETGAAQLWHRRLGHASFSVLTKMQRDKMVEGLDVSPAGLSAAQDETCEPCVMGKQHRAAFPTSTTQATKRLQLVHMDVCGPMQARTAGKARYFVGLLDDATRWSEICLIEKIPTHPQLSSRSWRSWSARQATT
jgi:hypothetical protein